MYIVLSFATILSQDEISVVLQEVVELISLIASTRDVNSAYKLIPVAENFYNMDNVLNIIK